MGKIIGIYLSAGRERRKFAVKAVIWLLRQVLEAESDEMWRCSDLIDGLDANCRDVPMGDYYRLETECLVSEHAVGFLESVIDDLGFTY